MSESQDMIGTVMSEGNPAMFRLAASRRQTVEFE